MTYRTIAFVALILALISGGIYWFVTLPTPEERTLVDFFDEFRHGMYSEAEDLTVNDDFYSMAASTKVRDTNGTEYTIGDYFPENRSEILRYSIEQYVKPHIAHWEYMSMDTQKFEPDSEESIVHFRIEIGIRDFTGGNLMGGAVHDGRVEGIANMVLENGDWKVVNFEFSLFSDEDLLLSNYLQRAE